MKKLFSNSGEKMIQFLNSTLVYKQPDDHLSRNIDLSQHFSQEELVDQVITHLLRKNEDYKNILTRNSFKS
jgi:hypothetical protein